MKIPIDDYQTLEKKLNELIPKIKFSSEINLKLERITHLLHLLDNPQNKFKSIHIGGTSGKGSTATLTASILETAGYSVGLHTSPHLQILNERHVVNNLIAPTSTLLSLFETMRTAIEQVAADLPFGKPSYFEAQFALTCLYFAHKNIDVAVIEVGLGGTLDATNVINSCVAVLVSVGLDHTHILGDTIEEIITDKAGIIKPNQVVITGVSQPTAHVIIADRAEKYANPLWSLGKEITLDVGGQHVADDAFTLTINNRTISDLTLQLIGDFQKSNAALATSAALAFDSSITDTAIRDGLQKVRFPGRMELIQTNPVIILDGAHNPDKMRHASSSLLGDDGSEKHKVILVYGMKGDKDLEEVLATALPLVDEVITTQFLVKGLWEPYPAQLIAEKAQTLAPEKPISSIPDPIDAIKTALEKANPDDVVWVTGSLYLVGDIRDYFYPPAVLIKAAESGLSNQLTPT